jgi:GT2 family glycosyltransferase
VIVGVNYDTDPMAVQFVRAASALVCDGGVSLVIVDNAEGGGREALLADLERADPRLRVVRAGRNLGYFGGAALGLREYVGAHGWPDWVMVANVDIEFRDPDLLRRLLDLPWPDNLGIVAPSIWSRKSLRDLNPRLVRRPRRATMKFYKLIFANVVTLNLYEIAAAAKHVVTYLLRQGRGLAGRALASSTGAGPRQSEGRRVIYAPQGSCLIFSRQYFTRGGTLDYPSFLFGEELYVAETARELGLAVVYEPRLKLWHDDHASTGLIRSRRIAGHQGRSARFIADRYFS